MNNRDEIIKFCEEYLEVKQFEDKCCNGLQLEGKKEIKKIITGVTFSAKLIDEAIKRKADMIMVHHGIFDNYINHPISIKGYFRERLKKMLENDINLVGFHLPLDAHEKIGNNVAICRVLGIEGLEKYEVGFVGELKEQIRFDDFVEIIKEKLEIDNPYTIKAGSDFVKKVAVVSGGASPYYEEAANLGADTFLTGDVRENVVREIEEVGMNFINAGHYNTEKLGIQNLGKLVAEKYNVEVEFVDVPNEI